MLTAVSTLCLVGILCGAALPRTCRAEGKRTAPFLEITWLTHSITAHIPYMLVSVRCFSLVVGL